MATYGEKVRKYEARVRKALELGLEPDSRDLDKLYYYTGRAEKKGANHPKELRDSVRNTVKDLKRDAKWVAELLVRAGKV